VGKRSWRKQSIAGVVAALLPMIVLGPAFAQEGQQTVGLSLGAEATRSLQHYKGHETQTLHERTAAFGLGEHGYSISYKAGYDDAHPGEAFPLEGYIGMPRPTNCNWYHSGFLFVRIDGQEVGNTALSTMTVSERDTRGILDLVWHIPQADVRVRFLGLPNRDYLLCEIAIDPRQPLKSVSVGLRCYPSFFTSHHKRVGARIIQTPSTLIAEGERATVPTADNWWALYADKVFDVGIGEGQGPCAMLLPPDEASEIRFAPGGYAVDTAITYSPETRRMHFAFWDLKGKTNAEALARVREAAEGVKAELAAMDFTPQAVTGFDVESVRADVQRALQSEAAREALGEKIAEIKTWLDEYAPALEAPTGAASIAAEEKLLASVSRYYGFTWELKLAELLAEL